MILEVDEKRKQLRTGVGISDDGAERHHALNGYTHTSISLSRHVAMLRSSYQRWTGRPLLDPAISAQQAVAWLDEVSFGLVSHGIEADPLFNYANRAALQLFGMDWAEFTAMPSRLSAGPVERGERAELLARVSRDGYIDDYAGIRVAKGGRRFMITGATVWNLLDDRGQAAGQAALIPHWEPWQAPDGRTHAA